MVTVLSEDDVAGVLDLEELCPVVADALVKQAEGRVERPERPHYPVGTGLENDEPLGTGVVMPAYIHGDSHFATKLVSLNEGNADRGLPTLHAQISLTNARTGIPEAFMGGTVITNARTGCIGALSVRELAPNATTLGVIGAGAQARWQTRAIDTVVDLESVKVYSPSDSRKECAADLRDEDIPATAVDSPSDAVESVDVALTATTATEPVFPAEALGDGTLVVGVGSYTSEMQEIEPAVFEHAAAIFADVPSEVAETGDLLAAETTESDLVPMGEMLSEAYEPGSSDDVLVVKSVGSATLDAAASQFIYRKAQDNDVGTTVRL